MSLKGCVVHDVEVSSVVVQVPKVVGGFKVVLEIYSRRFVKLPIKTICLVLGFNAMDSENFVIGENERQFR